MTPALHVQFLSNYEAARDRRTSALIFRECSNALPRMASPEIGHTPWRCPGVPPSGRASLLPSVRGSGLQSRAGDWDYLGFEPVSALAGLWTGDDWLFSYGRF